MKMLFLVPRLDKASTRYRVLQFLPYLEGAGVRCETIPLSKRFRNWFSLYRRLRGADCVFIQKKLFSPLELLLVRRAARRLVYDFDDAVMYKDGPAASFRHARQRRRFAAMVRQSDLIIAGNRYLWEEALQYGRPVELIPTTIDTNRYLVRPMPELIRGDLVLGWIGSRGTLKYLEQIAPALERLGRQFPRVRLKIVADGFFDLDQMKVIKKTWSGEEEISDLHSFDIGLMPLSDDPWTRGKCGFKLLQCMAVGLPVVCSPVGANREIVAQGSEGFWAASDEEWESRLRDLIENPPLRQEMGRNARKKVESHYSLQGNAPTLLNLFRHLHDRPDR